MPTLSQQRNIVPIGSILLSGQLIDVFILEYFFIFFIYFRIACCMDKLNSLARILYRNSLFNSTTKPQKYNIIEHRNEIEAIEALRTT